MMLSTLLLMCSIPDPLSELPASAEIALSKQRFLVGEPIEAVLTVTNRGKMPIIVEDYYPTYELDGNGIRFLPISKPKPLLVKSKVGSTVVFLKTSLETIQANRSWRVKIYLQRYIDQPAPGKYTIRYKVNIPCFFKRSSDLDKYEPSVHGAGELQFAVVAPEPHALRKIWEEYESKATSVKSDYDTRRAAIEALSVVEDPRVFPHLLSVPDPGGSPSRLLYALSRFSKDKAALKLLLERLQAKDGPKVVRALKVLADWEYELDIAQLRKFLTDEREEVRHAAGQYILSLDKPAYRQLQPKP